MNQLIRNSILKIAAIHSDNKETLYKCDLYDCICLGKSEFISDYKQDVFSKFNILEIEKWLVNEFNEGCYHPDLEIKLTITESKDFYQKTLIEVKK